jgi:microsomal dipeptidase-like Zn-dependent dipeptidase
MIVDLHSHYPMHLLADQPDTLELLLSGERASLGDRLRALVLRLANKLMNYPGSGTEPAVTVDNLRASPVKVALSMLFAPFDEMDLEQPYGAAPRAEYFSRLMAQIELVELDVAKRPGDITIAHNPAELATALATPRVALIHAVEGGFHLGDTEASVAANVEALALRGVACITVAHLFWRRVATNAPAIPFLSDRLYRLLFPQPAKGLGDLGRAAIRAMAANGILIDVTHMSTRSINETLKLLDEIDPDRVIPLMATHSACKLNGRKYNIADQHIKAIAGRRGVVGLIACTHHMAKGLKEPKTFADTMEIIYRHIDHLRQVTGSHEFTAFGSDQDGFIKPALPGLDTPAGFADVETALGAKYGAAIAEQICSGNALRVLQQWRGGPNH